jgi:hypothetical protein
MYKDNSWGDGTRASETLGTVYLVPPYVTSASERAWAIATKLWQALGQDACNVHPRDPI